MDEFERLAGRRLADRDVALRRIRPAPRRPAPRPGMETGVVGLRYRSSSPGRRLDALLVEIFVERLEGVDQRVEGGVPVAVAFQVDDRALAAA